MSGGGHDEKAAAPPATESSNKGSSLPLILSGVNLVVTLGMLGVIFLSFKRDSRQVHVEDGGAESETVEPKGGAEKVKAEGAVKGGEGKEGAKEGAKEGTKEGGKEGAKGEGEKKEGGAGGSDQYAKMVTLDQFTVNLSNPGSNTPRFVRANISVELSTDEAIAEVNSKMPQIRNVIIDLFNSKRPSDLASVQGRDYIKEEIKSAVNVFLVTGKLKGVFFTSFALAG